jgi:magnesium transporter
VTAARTIPILPEFDTAAIRQRLDRNEFFWADLTLDDEVTLRELETSFRFARGLVDALELFARERIVGGAVRKDEAAPGRAVYVDADHVVFPFSYVRWPDPDVRNGPGAIDVHRVTVVLHGDYLLTLHQRSDDLTNLVGKELPLGRSESYAVYVVLEAMNSTFFRALLMLQDSVGRLESGVLASGGRTRKGDPDLIRGVQLSLTKLRRSAGPERLLFERASGEMEHVPGLEAQHAGYFDRIGTELDRIIDGLDAISGELSNALDIQLNETTYRLTLIATIFLPLTFLTGFFGMNFDWMIGQVDSAVAFWLLGVGGCAAAVLLIVAFLNRDEAIALPEDDAKR